MLRVGAPRQNLLRLVLLESMTLVAIGVDVGVAAALGASRLIKTLLFGLAATDALSTAITVAIMVLMSALAGFLPACRASRVDPMVALRYD